MSGEAGQGSLESARPYAAWVSGCRGVKVLPGWRLQVARLLACKSDYLHGKVVSSKLAKCWSCGKVSHWSLTFLPCRA